MSGESVTVIIIGVLVIAFVGVILFLSFGYEEPEVKIAGLTFFVSLFLIGPFFSGIISIHAPVPMDSENTIEVVSIIVAAIMTAIALGIYKVIEGIRYRSRERKRTEKLGHKKGHALDAYTRNAEGDNSPGKILQIASDNNDNKQHELYLHSDILEIRITELDHYKYNGYEYLRVYFRIKNVGAVPISLVSIFMDIPFPEKEGYVEANRLYKNKVIKPGETLRKQSTSAYITDTLIKEKPTKCKYDYQLLQSDEYGITEYCVDKINKTAWEGKLSVKELKKKTRWDSYNPW